MSPTKRVAQYIQQLAYEALFQPDERDEWPEDVVQRPPHPIGSYAAWSATSFSSYVPFRVPMSG